MEILNAIFYIISFAFVSTVYAGTFIEGQCPDVKPISYLNLTQMTGTWYEIGRYPNDFESRGECASILITPNDIGKKFKLVDIANQTQAVLQGIVDYAPEAGTTGILNYYSAGLNATEGISFLQLFFLDFVYDSYCIVYECKYDQTKNRQHDYTWVMGRKTKLDKDTQKKVDAVLKSYSFIDTSKMSWEHFDQEACKIKSSK